jgi:hypothetical protein
VANALLNAAIGWAITRGLSSFPVWTAPGVVVDLAATAFGVAFGTVISAAFQVRWDLARGKITAPALPDPHAAHLARLLARLPVGALKLAFLLGVGAIPVFCSPAVVALAASGFRSLDRASFIELKAGFAAIEGAVVTPLIVFGWLLRLPVSRVPV